MNRRKALLGLAAGPLAATTVAFAQNGASGGGPVGTNLRALLTNIQSGAAIGTFDIKRFANVGGNLQAIGTLTATGANAAGTIITGVTTLAVPVTALTTLDPPDPATCPILSLTIGAIDLTLLGLQITTNPIVLNIVAIPGPGNLLGNLLCDIAGLLNPGGALTGILNQLVALLNQLLAGL